MPGRKGMPRKSAADAIRRKIWRSIRIMRRFTQPDLVRTVPDATLNNVGKYIHGLARHGYIAKVGAPPSRRPGDYQLYQLTRDTGPEHPNRCDKCGQPLTAVCCDPKEKEKEKEREKEKEEVSHDAA